MEIPKIGVALLFVVAMYGVSGQGESGNNNNNNGNNGGATSLDKNTRAKIFFNDTYLLLNRNMLFLGEDILAALYSIAVNCGCDGLVNEPNLPHFITPDPQPAEGQGQGQGQGGVQQGSSPGAGTPNDLNNAVHPGGRPQ